MRIDGRIEKIIYHSDKTGYTVALFQTEKIEVVCVGMLPAQEGFLLSIEGEFVQHSSYGEQFQVKTYQIREASQEKEILDFLRKHIQGVGESMANRLYDEFGKDVLDVIRISPELLLSVEGIGKKKLEQIISSYQGVESDRESLLFLSSAGLSSLLSARLIHVYGNEAKEILQENPYRPIFTVDGYGFEHAERVAEKLGFTPDNPDRHLAILYSLIQRSEQGGSTYVTKNLLVKKINEYQVGYEQAMQAIDQAQTEGMIVILDEKIFRFETYQAITQIAYHLQRLSEIDHRLPFSLGVEVLEESLGLSFSREQKRALENFLEYPFSIITGGPGTGKTTLIQAICEMGKEFDANIVLCAPTGRAAQRMQQASNLEAKTIHRTLEYMYETEENMLSFARDFSNPIEADLIIVDEASMIDIFLFEKLLAAIEEDTRVVIIGDKDQLPSVQAGRILEDMILSECIPTVELKEIFRQQEKSDIPLVAKHVKDGDISFSRDMEGIVTRYVSEEVAVKQLLLFLERYPNAQVLCPNKKGRIGVHAMNDILQKQFCNNKEPHSIRSRTFYEGDKVMFVRNNYSIEVIDQYDQTTSRGVFNGEIGVIKKVSPFMRTLDVLLDNHRLVHLDYNDIHEIELAYCMSVHKSQGCEYDEVIILMIHTPFPLRYRRLLYTAITRAKQKCYLLTTEHDLQQAISRDEMTPRRTYLCEQLKLQFGKIV